MLKTYLKGNYSLYKWSQPGDLRLWEETSRCCLLLQADTHPFMTMSASGWNRWVKLDSSGNLTPDSPNLFCSGRTFLFGTSYSVKTLPPSAAQEQQSPLFLSSIWIPGQK